MKKTLFVLLAAVVMLFASCKPKDSVLIVMPDGAPALVFAQMMKEDSAVSGVSVDYEIVAGLQGIQSKINDFDIAVMPLNFGANLYNQGEEIRLISVNIHGVLYIVGTEGSINTLDGLSTLKGQTVYNIGKGGTPDLTFRYMLENQNISYRETEEQPQSDEIALRYVTDGTQILAGLKGGTIDYAIIGEPMVTNAMNQVDGLGIIGDIQLLWKEATDSTAEYAYPQAGIFAKTAFIENNKELLKSILQKTEGGADWIKQNTADAITAMKDNNGTISTLTADSVTRSNIYTMYALSAKEIAANYFEILHALNANSIGGSVPDDNFYYDILS